MAIKHCLPAVVLLIGFIVIYQLMIVGTGGRRIPSKRTGSPLAAEPASIELGTLARGSSKSFSYRLKSNSTKHIRLWTEFSCDCLRLSPDPREIGPGQSLMVNGVLDLSHEPDFVGRLCSVIKGNSLDGGTKYQVVVTLTVQ